MRGCFGHSGYALIKAKRSKVARESGIKDRLQVGLPWECFVYSLEGRMFREHFSCASKTRQNRRLNPINGLAPI
jgi:hypothetical protein